MTLTTSRVYNEYSPCPCKGFYQTPHIRNITNGNLCAKRFEVFTLLFRPYDDTNTMTRSFSAAARPVLEEAAVITKTILFEEVGD